MPDDITPAPGGQTPPASPAPAGNPGNPPANPPSTPPNDAGTPPVPKEKPSNSTYARLRIAEKALKKQAPSTTPPPADDIDPKERETISKVVEEKYGHLDKDLSEMRQESDIKAIQEDVDRSITESPYAEYLTPEEKDKVHKYAQDPHYANIAIPELISLSISSRIVEIGAQMAKKASEKIKDTRTPASGSSMGTPKKTALEMSDAEWAQERKRLGFSS